MESEITTLWNGLEIVKLFVSVLTPIIVVIIGIRLNKIAQKLQNTQWTNQKIIEKRIEIYDELVPKLNDLLCYYCFIGNWKEFKPQEIIKIKRELDKSINIYAPLFSKYLKLKYDEYMRLCFETFTGWGNDAKIKSTFEKRKQVVIGSWNEEFELCFSKEITPHVEIREKYLELMSVFKRDLEILEKGEFTTSSIPILRNK